MLIDATSFSLAFSSKTFYTKLPYVYQALRIKVRQSRS